MPKPPLRVAILECDTPLPETQAKYTSYGGVFTSLLERAHKSLSITPTTNGAITNGATTNGPHPATNGHSALSDLASLPFSQALHISKYAVEQDPTHYPSLSSIDAILITGSRHDSFADNEWTNTLVSFVKTVLAQDRVRIIGVCYGHQIVGRAMGVKVGRNDDGWEAAVTEVDLTERGREVLGLKAGPLVRSIPIPIGIFTECLHMLIL
jgi:hypothetical protein